MTELSAKVSAVKSKNAGPFRLTIDLFFDQDDYEDVKSSGQVNQENIARVYDISQNSILGIYFVDFINAIKISLERPIPQGHPRETDIFGMNQHMPILSLEV
jgi:hypothetical protein